MTRKIAVVKSQGGLPETLQSLLGISVVDSWFDGTSFTNLAGAVSSIGSNEATLIISQVIGIGQPSLEVPANITLQFLPEGSLDISSGETVTIHGEIQASDTRQIKTGPGKLAFANPRRIPVPWFGVKAGTTTEQNANLKEACQALQDAGGGHLYFPPGTYRFYNDGGWDSPRLFKFEGLPGITITGYSVVLALDPARDWTTPPKSSNFFLFSNCHNIYIDGFEGTGPNIVQDGLYPYSVAFSRFEDGCSNVRIPYVRLQGWQAAVIASRQADASNPEQVISRGFTLGQIEVQGCTYGVNFQQSGHDTTIELLRTENVYRSFFIYGTENVRANVVSHNPKGRDIPMFAVCRGGTNIPLRNIKLKYTNIDSSDTGNKLGIHLYFGGSSSGGIIEDIELDIFIRYGTSDQMGSVLWISKLNDSFQVDGEGPRGHKLRNLRVSAFADGEVSNAGGYGGAVVRTQNGCDWTGEIWSNVVFENITVVNNTHATPVAIDPGANTDILTFKNVVLPKALHLWGSAHLSPFAPAAGKVIIDRVQCTNLDAYADNSLPVRVIEYLKDQTTLPLGWQGLTISNQDASTDIEYDLPAATKGLQYSFVRAAAGRTIRIDPNGNEVIRGGGPGKYLSMDSDGCFVTLRCYIVGTWEIIDRAGTTSFEP